MLAAEVFAKDAPASLQIVYADIIRAFEEVAQRAASQPEQDLDGLLELVGRKLCDLLAVRRCDVYVRDDEGHFHCRASYSAKGTAPTIGLAVGRPSDRLIEQIVQTRAPVAVHDPNGDRRQARFGVKQWTKHVLGVPLVANDDVVGIIFVDDTREDVFSGHDIAVAHAFASLAALAVQAARQSWELSRNLSVIERQKVTLEQLIDGQQTLARTVHEGADARGMLSALARLLGKPVVLYDAELRLLSTSDDDPDRRRAALVLPAVAHGVDWVGRTIRKLDAERRTNVLPPAIEHGLGWRHLICAVTIDAEVVGFVAVLEIGRPLSINDVRLTEHLATILSLLLHVDLQTSQSAGWLGEQLLCDLIGGRGAPAQLRRRAESLNVDLDQPHVLVRIERWNDEDAAAEAAGRDVVAELRVALDGGPILSATCADAHIALVPLGQGEAQVHDAISHVADGLHRAGVDITAGIAVGRGPADYVTAASGLRTLLRVAGRPGAVVSLQNGGLFSFIANDDALELARLAGRELLEPLVEHDNATDSHLVSTLRAFLDANAQIREAAKRLDVHENTVRYRLSRIRELSRVDPNRVDSLLEARLALHVHDLVTR